MTFHALLSRRSALKAGAAGVAVTTLGAPSSYALAQDATPSDSCPETTPEENVAIAKRWFTDLPEGLGDLITDDFSIEHGMGAELQDRQAVLERLMAISAAVPDSTHEYDVVMTDGDLVALRWKGTGTFDAEYMGVAPTGEEVTLSGIHIFRIECGRIAQGWAEPNLDQVNLQLLGGCGNATPAS
jgi:predicted ester cyclase